MKSPVIVGCIVAALGARFKRAADADAQASGVHVSSADIPCPTLAILVKNNTLNPDSETGMVTSTQVLGALMSLGPSKEAAAFLSANAVAFRKADKHQENIQAANMKFDTDSYLNLFTQNPRDQCLDQKNLLANGLPCNSNVGKQNHAISTTLRHPESGGSAESRFNYWFDSKVLKSAYAAFGRQFANKVGWSTKVMTVASMGAMIKKQHTKGDKSGEGSLNSNNGKRNSNLAKYHPSVLKNWNDVKVATQWQSSTAWSMFMAAWGRKYSGDHYLTESDLRTLILNSEARDAWSPSSWGWSTVYDIMIGMKGTGAGDEWIAKIKAVKDQLGPNPTELALTMGYGGILQGIKWTAD